MVKNIFILSMVPIMLIIAGCSSIQQDEITSFEECVEAGNSVMESYPRQCEANGETFVEELSLEETCENVHDGDWIESAQECEMINESTCTQMGGNFTECGSACRNDPDSEICTKECVPYCSFN